MIYHKYLEKICSKDTPTQDILYKDNLRKLVEKLLASKIQNIEHNKITLFYEGEQIKNLNEKRIQYILAGRMYEFIKILDKNIEKFLEQNPQYSGETIYTDKNIHNFFTDHIMNNLSGGWVEIRRSDIERIIEPDVDNMEEMDYEMVSAAFISEEILAYDSLVFSLLNDNENSDIAQIYRPFFLEVQIPSKYLKQCAAFKELHMSEDDEFVYVRCQLNEEKSDNGQECSLFSAFSPIKKNNKRIEIIKGATKQETENIKKTYSCNGKGSGLSTSLYIQNKLENIFKNVKFKYAKVYKVGNANCIYMYSTCSDGQRRLLYDIGIDYKGTSGNSSKAVTTRYQPSLTALSKINPSAVVISHWDMDHFIGHVYASEKIYDCLWVSPDLKRAGVNARRLAIYLYKSGKLLMIDSSEDDFIKVGDELELYKSEKKVKGTTPINCEGISIKIYNTKKGTSSLFMGDVPYSSLTTKANFEINSPYKTMVVPHHGAKMDYSMLSNIKKGKKAIICADGKNKYHPNAEHIDRLGEHYDKVVLTEKAKRAYIKVEF